MTITKASKKSQYRLYRWWKGDRFSPSQWIHSGDYRSNEQALRVVERMRKLEALRPYRASRLGVDSGR